MECTQMTDIIQCVCAVVACVLAWFIPKKIMWEQTYSTLIVDYRSYDFGIAVQGIVEFFTIDCESKTEKIKEKYEKRFVRDIYGSNLEFNCKVILENIRDNNSVKLNGKSPELCLHYQRRLLAQFYYQLDLCARSPFIGKRRVHRDFTKSEADLVRLVYLMNKAIEESDILRKDISCDERVPRNAKGINHYLSDIYRVLKTSKSYMEV